MERKTKKWLDAKIREVAKKEEAAERLAAEYQRRMALLKTKEDLEMERNRISSRRSPLPPPSLATVRDVIMKSAPAATTGTVISPTNNVVIKDGVATGVSGARGGGGRGEQEQQVQEPLTAEEEATLEELEERIEALQVGRWLAGINKL